MVIVTRDQQGKMTKIGVVVWSKAEWRGFGQDFSTIVDVERVGQLIAGAGLNERIQVEK